MPKKNSVDELSEIKKYIKEGKVVIGTDRTLKEMRQGMISKIYLSSNVQKELVETLEQFSKISDVELVRLSLANDDLGTLCRKPFSISILGVYKK